MNMSWFQLLTFIAGFITAVVSKISINWYYKPKLEISDRPLSVTSSAGLQVLDNVDGVITTEERINVFVYRIKVKNKGRTAARNVCATIEFNEYQPERRICWYEGNVPSMTINSGDHSFIDVYGVIIRGNNFTNEICFPTENGWIGLNKIRIQEDLNIKIRVTAENAEVKRRSFKINSINNCELESIN